MGANGNRYNFCSRVKTRKLPILFKGRAPICMVSMACVGITYVGATLKRLPTHATGKSSTSIDAIV